MQNPHTLGHDTLKKGQVRNGTRIACGILTMSRIAFLTFAILVSRFRIHRRCA